MNWVTGLGRNARSGGARALRALPRGHGAHEGHLRAGPPAKGEGRHEDAAGRSAFLSLFQTIVADD